MKKWLAFPHPSTDYEYPGAALKKQWARLHRGDQEPYPSAELVAEWLEPIPARKRSRGANDPASVAQQLQDAWRLLHQGKFQQAAQAGADLGVIGYVVANKATLIYASYLEQDEAMALKLYQEAADRAEQAQATLPKHANSYYLLAYALGRYSQKISVIRALTQGLGGKVKDALDRTLALAPEHGEAHIALGTYHAEIIAKVGSLIGGLTYGASEERAREHFQTAIKLLPSSAIARIEYANGLRLLDGERGRAEARKLLAAAARLEPRDAMERLDVELAKSLLEKY